MRLFLGFLVVALAIAPGGASAATHHKWYTVPLVRLLHPAQLHPKTHTTTIGSTLFRYAWHGYIDNSANNFGGAPQIDTILKRNSTSCKSVTFTGGSELENSVSADPLAELDGFRENASEVRLAIPLNSVASLGSFTLPVHHAFVIKVRTGNNNPYQFAAGFVWLNGSARCYTHSGKA